MIDVVGADFAAAENQEIKGEIVTKILNDLQGRFLKCQPNGNVFSLQSAIYCPQSRSESRLKIRNDLHTWKRRNARFPPRLPRGPVQDMVDLAVHEEGDDNAPIVNIKEEEADILDLSGGDDDASISLEEMEDMLRRKEKETKKELQKKIDRLEKRREVLATENIILKQEDL